MPYSLNNTFALYSHKSKIWSTEQTCLDLDLSIVYTLSSCKFESNNTPKLNFHSCPVVGFVAVFNQGPEESSWFSLYLQKLPNTPDTDVKLSIQFSLETGMNQMLNI